MKEANRKVDMQARDVIANILLFETSDPRLQMVTITNCKVSYDRAYCDVFYTADPDRYAEVSAALDGCKGRIRTLMAKELSWKQAPELRFHLDDTVDAAERLGRYINEEKERRQIWEKDTEESQEL